MANPQILWGSINSNGGIESTSGGFKVKKESREGEYTINFDTAFKSLPSIVGSQTQYGDLHQATTDNVVFPFVDINSATVLTGGGDGAHVYRPFSFIAFGEGTPTP